jgi:hypothetical protein
MATSSKVLFKLEELQSQALSAIDEQIRLKENEVYRLEHSATLDQENAWRAGAEAKISDVFRRLDTIDNDELSQFRLSKLPHRDEYQHHRAERELESLRTRRGKIVAKSGALVPDESGNIALTKTQLAEFFDL